MKQRIVSLILILLFAACIILPVIAADNTPKPGQTVGSTLEKFMKADTATKKKAFEFLLSYYPGLRKEVSDFVYRTSPQTPAKIRASQMKMLAEKYPALPVKLPRLVLEDLSKKNPSLVMDIAVDVSTLICEKYPAFPSDMVKWRATTKNRSAIRKMIEKNHPTLMEDVKNVIVTGGYAPKIEQLKVDLKQMMMQKHPALARRVITEVRTVIRTKYPDLPEKIEAIRDNPKVNPRFAIPELIAKDYPELVPDVLTVVRDKYGVEIQGAIIDALYLVEDKYPELVTDLPGDMSAMMAAKHPTMMLDIHRARMDSRTAVAGKVKSKYPNLRKDLKTMLESKYNLAPQVEESIKKHFPELKKDVTDVMKTHYSGFIESIEQEIDRKHPELQGKISKILDEKQ